MYSARVTEERDLIGKTLGHYEILKPLGAGGMGEVYRALDTNLRRDVAIKVLPEGLSADPERLARLRREAHLLASVNHPNIAAIYNLEESEGTRWLVLELVEGKTLEQTLRNGPMPAAKALRVGAQVASALEAAHERGIVHRDLKSANVMIDAKGRVKVLDFGIAKDISGQDEILDAATSFSTQTGSGPLTATGVIVGTAPYMSPEQIRGRKVDKRIDTWAFGCLMFELLTGKRPFDRETMADTLSAILEHEPDWDLLPADTPEGMEELLRDCLQKDADNRLGDIADARAEIAAIEATATGSTFPTRRRRRQPSTSRLSQTGPQVGVALVATILTVLGVWWGVSRLGGADGASEADVLPVNAVAVLPFANLNLEPDETAFYVDGLAITVLSALQGVDGLIVPAWTSTSTFRDSDEDPATIGRDLGVSKLLSGTVQFSGTQLVVTVELTEVESGLLLWTTVADWPLDDLEGIFLFQDEVAREVAAALDLELSGDDGLRPTQNLEAYNAYLRGLEAYPRRDREGLFDAQRFFEEAIGLDPDFAQAHAELAVTHVLKRVYVVPRGAERRAAVAAARESVEAALALDRLNSRALGIRGAIKADLGEDGWDDDYETSLALNPNDDLIHHFYGSQLFGSGAIADAWSHTFKAAELDPRMPEHQENLAMISLARGDFSRAIQHGRQAIALDAQYPLGYMILGQSLRFSGDIDEGVERLREAWRLNPTDYRHWVNLALALVESGDGDEAESLLREWAGLNRDDYFNFLVLGEAYRTLGSLDDAAAMYELSSNLSPSRGAGARPAVALILLDLDRGDETAAEQGIAALEDWNSRNGWTRIGRLNLDMYGSRFDAEPTAGWRSFGGVPLFRTYFNNLDLYFDQPPIEPIGYFGVLAGEPEESLRVFETSFPELLEDEPPVHAFTLKAAIDLAAVYKSMNEDALANRLLDRAEDYLAGLPAAMRQYQFRDAPMHIYALQGRTEEALDAMRQAIDDGFVSGWWRLPLKPHFESLRDNPRFQDMVEELRQKATDETGA